MNDIQYQIQKMSDKNQLQNQNVNSTSRINTLQPIPDSLQLPVYGFVFLAGLVVGSLFIQSLIKK